jgi:hypothetical protein
MSPLTHRTRHAERRVNRRTVLVRLATSAGTPSAGAVAGTISGPNSGDLSTTIVFLYNAAQQSVTAPALPIVASDGTYAIANVPAGKWMAFCQPAAQTPLTVQTYNGKPGFKPHGTLISVRNGLTVTGVDFALTPAGLLTVTVVNSTGVPVAGTILLNYLVDRNRLTCGMLQPPTTDATGSAILANVPLQSKLGLVTPGGTFVWWDAARTKHRSQTLVIPGQGELLSVTVTLPPGA